MSENNPTNTTAAAATPPRDPLQAMEGAITDLGARIGLLIHMTRSDFEISEADVGALHDMLREPHARLEALWEQARAAQAGAQR